MAREQYLKVRQKSDLHHLRQMQESLQKLIDGPDLHYLEYSSFQLMNQLTILPEYHDQTKEGAKRSFYLSKLRHLSQQEQRLSCATGNIKSTHPHFPWEVIENLDQVLALKRFSLAGIGNLCQWSAADLAEFKQRLLLISYEAQILYDRQTPALVHHKLSYPNVVRRLFSGIQFSSDTNTLTAGLPRFRALIEPFLDHEKVQLLLDKMTILRQLDETSVQGREAIVTVVQQIGEAAGHVSESFRVMFPTFPCQQLKQLRNDLAHAWDFSKSSQQLKHMIATNPNQIFTQLKGDLLSLESQLTGINTVLTADINTLKAHVENGHCDQILGTRNRATYLPTSTSDQATLKKLFMLFRLVSRHNKQDTKTILLTLKRLYQGKLPVPQVSRDQKKLVGTRNSAGSIQLLLGVDVSQTFYQLKREGKFIPPELTDDFVKSWRQHAARLLPQYPSLTPVVNAETPFPISVTFSNELKKDPVAFVASKESYEAQQLLTLFDALKSVRRSTKEMMQKFGNKPAELRAACRSGTQYHQSVLFHFTVIGQCIQNLRAKDPFCKVASASLRLEFETLRWIRNSLMHGMSVDEAGSMLRYFNNDLLESDLQHDGARAFDSSGYLKTIEGEIKHTLKRLKLYSKSKVLFGYPLMEEATYQRSLIMKDLREALDHEDHTLARLLLKALGHQYDDTDWYSSLFAGKELVGKKDSLMISDIFANKEAINKLAKLYGVRIKALFGDILHNGFDGDGGLSGLLLEIDSQDSQEQNLAMFKVKLHQLLGIRLLCVTQSDLVDYFVSRGDTSTDAKEQAEQFISEKVDQYSFEKVMRGYELFKAVESRDVDEVKRLLQLRPWVDINIKGYTPLHLALMDFSCGLFVGKSYAIAALLLTHGANPNALDKHGKACLHYAALDEDYKELGLLLRFDANVNLATRHGETALQMTLAEEENISPRMIRRLLQCGAKPGRHERERLQLLNWNEYKRTSLGDQLLTEQRLWSNFHRVVAFDYVEQSNSGLRMGAIHGS